ncbi:hydroxymethylpyrimidine/phosphomethylpyrimidine kinase [Mesorhizobium sp. L-8-10]|uniref:bifunctional hydroxymethylpyrimidine kinase/phosphomethylpyrimidine kinase n=1 Tax=Mesorhizobium sp. L-8-10 TaxID=2744523 RepID=UPI001925CA44|nr:bifunctional hydroxymethylpyrimidine kinase/phosphomethylpyrimidine kinase [Mesorhizobium sp. L-8-10]BCH34685.1 hydroxymethylpyrimidine/phosphomethylpyrimidine kinase [Mesorhizobium sp. L-8-10]
MAMTPHVLVVAGSDSSGGAGIARDIETIAAFGLRSCLAITAVTVQTHDAVEAVELVAPALVAAQMRAALAANPVAAVKIGMLGAGETVGIVADVLEEHPGLPVVLDPVLVSTSGRALLAPDAAGHLRQRLMPLCRLVTPNLPELALLTGSRQATDETELLRQTQLLFDAGVPALLIKGGHAGGERSTDLLLRPGEPPLRFAAPRLEASMRGTGCMLASSVAAHLAQGQALEEAVRRAKLHVFDALRGKISSPR